MRLEKSIDQMQEGGECGAKIGDNAWHSCPPPPPPPEVINEIIHRHKLAALSACFTSSGAQLFKAQFSSDPGVPGVRSMGLLLSNSLSEPPFANLTDVTLADEDSNSTPADDVNRAILGNVAMQMTQPDGKIL